MPVEHEVHSEKNIVKNVFTPKSPLNLISFLLLLLLGARYCYLMLHYPYGYASLRKFIEETKGVGENAGTFELIFYLLFILPLICIFPTILGVVINLILSFYRRKKS